MLNDLAVRLGWPIYALSYPQADFYWPYLISTGLAALLLCYWRSPAGLGQLGAAPWAVVPACVLLHPSALLDYRFLIVNHVVNALGLGLLTLSVAAVTDTVDAGLTFLFGSGGTGRRREPLPTSCSLWRSWSPPMPRCSSSTGCITAVRSCGNSTSCIFSTGADAADGGSGGPGQ